MQTWQNTADQTFRVYGITSTQERDTLMNRAIELEVFLLSASGKTFRARMLSKQIQIGLGWHGDYRAMLEATGLWLVKRDDTGHTVATNPLVAVIFFYHKAANQQESIVDWLKKEISAN